MKLKLISIPGIFDRARRSQPAISFHSQVGRQLFPIWLFVLMFAAAFLGTPGMMAQSGAGSIQGTVSDSTGGRIPGAVINVINTDTAVSTATKSNDAGYFQVPELFTGHYRVTVVAPGMKTYVSQIDLQVQQNAVINPVLPIGQITEEVTVTSDAIQLVTKDNGSIESTLENERINQLPMNSRLLLTSIGNTTPGLENGGQNINGLGPEGLEYVADGVTTTNVLNGGEYNNKTQGVDPDAVQEVKIEVTGAGAQFATPATGIITTKSGTNKIHGSLFETARNNAIGAARGRGALPQAPPQLIRNEFGISAGGPVFIPHLYDGRDKTFWFFAYERYSLAQGSIVHASVPTMAMRGGDFSGLTDANNNPITIYDPSTTKNSATCSTIQNGVTVVGPNAYCRTPFPNNQIPMSQLSPLAKIGYDITPQPTLNTNPYITPNLTQYVPQYQVVPQETFRIDHVFNQNNRVYLRYTHNFSNINITGGIKNLAADGIPAGAAQGYTNNPTNTFIGALGYTHVFSSTFYAETILSQEWFNQTGIPGFANHTNYEQLLNLPNNFGEVGFPAIGNGTLLNNFSSSQTGHEISQLISNLDENMTKIKARHQMQFGGRIRHLRAGDQPQGLADSITFGVNPTAIYNASSGNTYNAVPYSGLADAGFFLGSAGAYSVTEQPPFTHYYLNEFDLYFQDNYHVTKNLTLNVGLRYEAHPAVYTRDGLANTFDLKNHAMVLGATPAQLIAKGYTTQAIITNDQNIGIKFETPSAAGMPDSLMKDYNWNFLPRVGAAYVLPFNGQYATIVRGSFGMFDYLTPLENFVNHPEQNNPFVASYSQSYSAANQAIDGQANELLRYNGPVQFGVAGKNTQNVVNSNAINAIVPGVTLFSVSPDWKPARVTEANFTIEQPLKGGSALRVSYVYTRAVNLDIANNYNNPLSTFQWEMATGTTPPTGGAGVIGTAQQNTYAATALGPYDQSTYGNGSYHTKAGWSNDNSLQVNYQRLYHNGSAYQIAYVLSKSLRFGGDQQGGYGDVTSYPLADYPGVQGSAGSYTVPAQGTLFPGATPPARPGDIPTWQDYHALDKFEGYQLDTTVPKMHVLFNGILDLPFGRGKRYFGHVNRFWNEIIGGFQIAGDGNIVSQAFNINGGNWGAPGPIKLYKHKNVSDCRSGPCQPAIFWFNGYQSPKVYQGCTASCIVGMPAGYVPDQAPINNVVGTQYFGTGTVNVQLANGKTTTQTFDGGPLGSNYLSKAYLPGPINWTADISLFKVFPITNSVNFRLNVDAFNAFNMQGLNNPGSGGVIMLTTYHNTPRQIQITARLSF